jgi:hypothetical protein
MSNTSIKPDQIKANFNFNLNDRLTGKASATYLFWFIKVSGASTYSDIKGINITNGSNNIVNIFNRFGKMEKVKSAAVYDAVQGYDIDVIVNPQFETKTTTFLWFVKTYSARVKAYEGQIIELYQEKDDVILYDLILKKN